MVHDLKCWPAFFAGLRDGTKPFELRRNDRNYQVGDELLLREWLPGSRIYTGFEVRARVTCIISEGPWLAPGYVAMGLARLGP